MQLTAKEIKNKVKFRYRTDTYDRAIIDSVFTDGYYLLSSNFKINEGDVVIDIGSHIGSFSILAGYLGAEVLSYEPVYDNYEILIDNIKYNGLDKVLPFNLAVTADGRDIKLFKSKKKENGLFNTGGWSVNEGNEYVLSESVSIDDVLSSFKYVDFIKMDCEGCEYEIIKKADLSNVDKLVIESHKITEAIEILKILKNSGFTIERHRKSKENPDLSIIYAYRSKDAQRS